jgi:hypothetical protein
MSRTWIPRCFVGLFVLLFASPAFAQFEVSFRTFTDTGVVVKVRATYPGTSCTIGPFPYCVRAIGSARVVPCPPGQSCPNGWYSFPVNDGSGTDLVLDFGTTYHFTGSWNIDTGPRVNNVCTYNCSQAIPIPAATYSTPSRDDMGEWIVTPVETAGDNVWVDLDLQSDYVDFNPCFSACRSTQTYVEVTPCPLAARRLTNGQPSDLPFECSNGTASFLLFALATPDPPLQLLFAPGDYEIDASWRVFHMQREQGGACTEQACQFYAHPNNVEFSTSTLAVEKTTWGRVKAMYRE